VNNKLVVSSSPHIRSPETISSVMLDVIVALFPVALASVLLFGYNALIVILVAVAAAMIAETAMQAVMYRKLVLVGDGSAAVTGLLLALTLPASVPWWIPVVGSACAIIIAKHLFGGLGNNIFNPALVGRAILTLSWGTYMVGSVWPGPRPFEPTADLTTKATPLDPMEGQEIAMELNLSELFLGNMAGSLGETSALAILIGAFWLFYKGHIDWRIPGSYLATVFVLGAALGEGFYHGFLSTGLFHVLAGGVLLGALFMATDLVTSPVTPLGRLIFGVGCGVITMAIRLFSDVYPEGVTFAILLMNAVTPIIDKATVPKKFGEVKK